MEWIIGFAAYIGLITLIIAFMMGATRKEKEMNNEL
jgi:hypothetical protein